MCPPRGSFAQPEIWGPDIAQDLPTHWPETRAWYTSMRGDCVICGRGRGTATGTSARRLHDFSSRGLWRFPAFLTGVFPLRPEGKGFADSPPVDCKLLTQLFTTGTLPTSAPASNTGKAKWLSGNVLFNEYSFNYNLSQSWVLSIFKVYI